MKFKTKQFIKVNFLYEDVCKRKLSHLCRWQQSCPSWRLTGYFVLPRPSPPTPCRKLLVTCVAVIPVKTSEEKTSYSTLVPAFRPNQMKPRQQRPWVYLMVEVLYLIWQKVLNSRLVDLKGEEVLGLLQYKSIEYGLVFLYKLSLSGSKVQKHLSTQHFWHCNTGNKVNPKSC